MTPLWSFGIAVVKVGFGSAQELRGSKVGMEATVACWRMCALVKMLSETGVG